MSLKLSPTRFPCMGNDRKVEIAWQSLSYSLISCFSCNTVKFYASLPLGLVGLSGLYFLRLCFPLLFIVKAEGKKTRWEGLKGTRRKSEMSCANFCFWSIQWPPSLCAHLYKHSTGCYRQDIFSLSNHLKCKLLEFQLFIIILAF